jgi:hypothetical protein
MRWKLSVLGSAADTPAAFRDALDADLALIDAFAVRARAWAVPDMMEVRLPTAVIADGETGALPSLISESTAAMARCQAPLTAVYFEIGFPGRWEERVPEAIRAVAQRAGAAAGLAAGAAGSGPGTAGGAREPLTVGVKIRTGGVEASAFPSPEQVALFITAARDAGVPFKATAGLHHPVRHHCEAVGTAMHGFLNVFGAAVLAHALGADTALTRDVIEDEAPGVFEFDEMGFSWRGHRVSPTQIEEARRDLAHSFGSCSFTEPVEDLETLGYL